MGNAANIIYYLICLILLSGCHINPISSPNKFCGLLDNAYTTKYPELKEVDSLSLSFKTQDAIDGYQQLMASSPIDSVRRYAATQLSEMKHQHEFLYHEIEDVDSNYIIDELSFYRTLRLKPISIRVPELLEQLKESNYLSDSLKVMTQLSIAADQSGANDDEVMEEWIKTAFDIIVNCPNYTALHHAIYMQMIEVKGYSRQNLLGVGIANDALESLGRLDAVDIRYRAETMLKRAYALARSGQYNEACVKECLKIQELIPEDCNPLHVRSIGCEMYAYHFLYDSVSYKSSNEKLLHVKQNCPNNIVNIDRVISQIYFYKGDYEKSLDHGLLAKTFEENNIFRTEAQYETILYVLSLCSQNLKDFVGALDYYYRNKKIPNVDNYDVFELLQHYDNPNSFVMMLRFAEIHYAKWQERNSLEDLNNTILLLRQAEKNMNSQLTTIDENALLRFFNYQNSIYEQLSIAYRDKFRMTGTINYKEEIVENLSKKKNLLLQREISMKADGRYITDELKKKRKQLIREAESVKLKGIVDNQELSKVLWKMAEVTQEVSRSYGKNNIDALKLKDRLSTEEIKNSLDLNTCMISYYIIEDELAIVYYENEEIEIYYESINQDFLSDIKAVGELQSDVFRSDINDYQTLSYRVFSKLFPDGLYQKCKERIVVIPDGDLNYINMEALVHRVKKDVSEYSDLSYILYDREINYLPSDQLIENCKDEININHMTSADVFSFSDDKTIDAPKQTYLSELPFAIKENDLIMNYFTAANSYTGADATKENFVQALSSNDGYIHVSTHGNSGPAADNQLKLYFRNSDLTLDSLQAYELLDIESDAALIFLSSCQSGTGHLIDVEGVYDLKRYFLQSGVRRIVSSIWNVDDYTSQQMTDFLLQNNFNLRKAKLQFLEENAKRSHPYYWSGFVY